MRKLFFLLMLVTGMVTAQPNASNTQTIGKYLKLSKVPIGLETDNVLVRGSDNIVRYVPKSQFGGGGGSQNLQSVLNAGSQATNISNLNVTGDNGKISIDPSNGTRIFSFNNLPILIQGPSASATFNNLGATINGSTDTGTNGVILNGRVGGIHLNGEGDQSGPNSGTNIHLGNLNIRDGYELSIFDNGGTERGKVSGNRSSGITIYSEISATIMTPLGSGLSISSLETRLNSQAKPLVITNGGVNSPVSIESNQGKIALLDNIGVQIDGRAGGIILNGNTKGITLNGQGSANEGVTINGVLKLLQTNEPSSASDTGTAGEIRIAGGYVYWCTAPNTWVRATGTTF